MSKHGVYFMSSVAADTGEGSRPDEGAPAKDGSPRSRSSPVIRRSPIFVILLTVFVDLIGFGIIIPLLPFYAEELGASPTILGVLIGSFSLMQFLFAPVLGSLSDRFGRRPILLMSLVGSISGHLLFAVADTLLVLFLSRITAGLAASNLSVAQAYISDVTSSEERAKGMGYIGASFGVGFVIGPVIGGSLIAYGFSAPGFAAAAISLVNLLLAYGLLPESLARRMRTPRDVITREIGGFLSGFRRPIIRLLLITFFVVYFAFATIPVAFPLIGIELFGLGPAEMSLVFIFIGAVELLVQGVVFGRIARRIGEEPLLVLGTVLMAVGILLIPLIPELRAFIFLTGLLSTGLSFANPAVPSMISKLSSPSEQGNILGQSRSVASLARVPAPLTGGWMFEQLGSSSPFVASALLMVIGLVLSVEIWLRSRG
jgi:MFS family permease